MPAARHSQRSRARTALYGVLVSKFKGSTRNSRRWTRRPFSDSAIVAGVAVVNMLSKSIPH